MRRLSRHLSYANVMATIATGLALAGGTTAIAGKKKPTTKGDITKKGKIKPRAVTARTIADGAVGARQLGEIRVEVSTPTAQSFPLTHACAAGERRLGGGVRVTPVNASTKLYSSFPGSIEPESWQIDYDGGGTFPPSSAVVYTVCLAPGI